MCPLGVSCTVPVGYLGVLCTVPVYYPCSSDSGGEEWKASALPPQTDGGSRAAAGVAEKLAHFFWRDWRSTIVQIVVYSIY